MKGALRPLAVLLVAAVFAACTTVPYTERSRFIAVSEREEIALGEAAFQEVEKVSVLVRDERLEELEKVGNRIAAAAGRRDFRWKFLLIESDEANAFALPGGKVAFYTGILPYCEGEAGVAAVMAHEVAHVLARHGAERLSQARLLEFGGAALSAVFSGGSPALQRSVMGAYGLGGKIGVLLPFSRKHEAEADAIGLFLMAKAGFDPRAAPAFWKRLLSAGKGGRASDILSSHPSVEQRLRGIEELMPMVLEYYRKVAGNAPGKAEAATSGEEAFGLSVEEVLRRLRSPGPLAEGEEEGPSFGR